jgi:hypothetical protein
MSHQDRDSELPITRDTDRIADSAVNYCEAVFVERAWKFRRQEGRTDFGVDAEGEIVESNRVTGRIFKLQVKGSESLDPGSEVHTVYVKRSTYNLWESIPLPVIALLCDVRRKVIYWAEPLSQVPKPGAATVALRFYAPQTLPETFVNLSRLLSTWFLAYSDNILFEVPYFYEIFYEHLKVQMGMDYGCEIDEATELEIRLFYRHLLQLRLRLGLDCTKLPPLGLWYLRSAAVLNEPSILCSPIFDEFIIYIERDYQEAIDELRKRTADAEICFENHQVVNFFRGIDGNTKTFFSFPDPRFKDTEIQRKFEKLLQSRNAVKVHFQEH